MLAEATDDRPTGSRFRTERWLPFALAIVVLYVATSIVLQITHPFLAHDDWEYELPAGAPGVYDLHLRNIYEGRWLNYLWWRFVGQHGSPVSASLTFQLAYLAFVLWFAIRLSPRQWLGFLTFAAIFVSPMWIKLAYWPAVQSLSAIVLAAAVWVLPRFRTRVRWLAVWLAVFTLLSAFTYPPVAAVAFLVMVVDQIDRKFWNLFLLGVWFAVAYVASLLATFTVNWFVFSHFGLKIKEWRDPNPVHGLGDLVENTQRLGGQWWTLAAELKVPLSVALVAIVVGLAVQSTRRNMSVLLLAGALAAGLEAGATLSSGTLTAARGSLWAWIVIVVPITWVAQVRTRVRIAGIAGLAIVAIWGVLFWSSDVRMHQAVQSHYDAIGDKVAAAHEKHPARWVVMYTGGAETVGDSRYFTNSRSLQMSILEQHGITVRLCRPAICDRIREEALPVHQGRRTFLFEKMVIVVAPQPRWWM